MPAARSAGVLILTGPTAAGKTELALALAERWDAEIVSADSRQIYRGMPIGTAAPTAPQLARVAHHLVGFVDPYERYSAARFVVDAVRAIDAIHARGKRVIVAGGTGFYLRALCGDVTLAAQPAAEVRARITREIAVHPLDVLHDWLRSRDAPRAAAVAPSDAYRIARSLETRLQAGLQPAPAAQALPTLRARGIRFTKIALLPERGELAERIARRTDAMLAAGFVEEAERIGPAAVAADAVGYRDALAFARGWLTAMELRALLARATRHYAKRQLTWLRAERDVSWISDGDVAATLHAAKTIGWSSEES